MAIDPEELERELCRIPEVYAARIVVAESGQPTEARILASQDRPPTRVLADVRSVVMASFGVDISPDLISVTQIEHVSPTEPISDLEPEAGPELAFGPTPEPSAGSPGFEVPPSGGAPAFGVETIQPEEPQDITQPGDIDQPAELESATITTHKGRCAVEIIVHRARRSARGDAEGALTRSVVWQLTAKAALSALAGLSDDVVGCEVESAWLTTAGDRSVAVVLLALPPHLAVTGEVVSGSAVVGEAGEHEAIARAALDAAERALAL